MFVLRLGGLLAAIMIATLLLSFMLTRNRRYLQLALRVFVWSGAAALLFLVLMLAERLIVLL